MTISPLLDGAGQRALELIRHQFSGDREALGRELAASALRPLVDTQWLAEAWSEALRQVGELLAVEEPALHLRDDLQLVVEVPLRCARGDLSEQVTFDACGSVTAVALLPLRA